MHTSVIISFYNNISFLKLVIAGFESQSCKDFDIVIADDGSLQKNVDLLESMVSDSSLDIAHVWQSDMGFRKNRILNRAVMTARGEYLIIIDGDCIPHRFFVQEHIGNRAQKTCLLGRRVELSEQLSANLDETSVRSHVLDRSLKLYWDGLLGQTRNAEKGIYLQCQWLRKLLCYGDKNMLGSNFSLYKKDLIAVNGFDQRYEFPGIGEDSDLDIRLRRSGIKMKSVNNIAIQYHLFHPVIERDTGNIEIFKAMCDSDYAFTPYGISSND